MRENNLYIYNYKSYKLFLNEYIKYSPNKGRGLKSQIARLLNCKPAYITQILNSHLNFSMDQTVLVTDFLNLSKEETAFFILLVQYNKAGSKKLEDYLLEQIQDMQLKAKKDMGVINSPSKKGKEKYPVDISVFASSWMHSAIPFLVEGEKCNTIDMLGIRLKTAEDIVKSIVTSLVNASILSIDDEGIITMNHLNLQVMSSDPISERNYHIAWRQKSLLDLSDFKSRTIRPTSTILTIKKKYLKELKSILNNTFKDFRRVIGESEADNDEDQEYASCAINVDVIDL